MPLSPEQKKQLEELQRLSQEPESPPANVNFNLDLSSDTAWERAVKLGIVREPAPEASAEDGGGEGDDPPRRRSGGAGFFGGN